MHETTFPVFKEGQTLTEADLNLLRSYLRDSDQLLGRLIGFGINCGLNGSVLGPNLTLEPGLAVDQHGSVLVFEGEGEEMAPQVFSLPPPLDSDTPEFPFIDTSQPGISAVLELVETTLSSPECEEEGCEGHAETTEVSVRVVFVEGCLTETPFSIEDTALGGVSPITVSERGFTGASRALEAALAGVLDPIVSTAAREKLSEATIHTGDLAGIKAWKAAFLNELYFAVLDYLRCEALAAVDCLRRSTRPGVVLGYLTTDGSEWRWDCSKRHEWEPPAGLSMSLLGGDCDDPCRIQRERIESMLITFALPEVPEKDDPPATGGDRPGKYPICPDHRPKGRYDLRLEKWWTYDRCINWYFPPPRIPDDYLDRYEFDPRIKDYFRYGEDIRSILDDPAVDPVPDRTISVGFAIGRDPEDVRLGIEKALDEVGYPSDVVILEAGAVARTEGFQPGLTAGVDDTIYLVQDGHGKVVQTGFKRFARTTREFGSTIGDLSGRVDGVETFGGDIAELSERMAGAEATGMEVLRVIQGGNGTEGLLERLDHLETLDFATGTDIQVHVDLAKADLALRLGEVERTLTIKLDDGLARSNGRIDQAYSDFRRSAGIGPAGGDVLSPEMIGVIRSMQEAVRAAASGRQRAAVDRALTDAADDFEILEGAARTGGPLVSAERVALDRVFNSFSTALRSAGAPDGEALAVEDAIGRFRRRIGP